MSARTKIWAILALPAAVIGFAVSTAILSSLLPRSGLADLIILIVPVLIAGLCMVPFVIPALDAMAKRDLAAHRAATESAEHDAAKPDAKED